MGTERMPSLPLALTFDEAEAIVAKREHGEETDPGEDHLLERFLRVNAGDPDVSELNERYVEALEKCAE